MIDSRVEYLFKLVLALPPGEVQQRALVAALNVADAKSRLLVLVDVRTKVNENGAGGELATIERMAEAANEAFGAALLEAQSALDGAS